MTILRRLFGRANGSRSAGTAPVPNVLSQPAAPNANQPTAIATIGGALDAIAAGRIGFAIVTPDEPRNYYVQVAGDATGGLVAEAVSDAYLKRADRLGESGAARLRGLGWVLDGDGSGNWSREYPDFPHDGSSPEIESLLADTLESVYGWTGGSPLVFKTGD